MNNPPLTLLSVKRIADVVQEGRAGQTQDKHRHSKEQNQ